MKAWEPQRGKMDCILKVKCEQSGIYFMKNCFLNGTFSSYRRHYWTEKTQAQCNSVCIYHSVILTYLLRVNNSLSIKLLTLNESLMVKMGCL